MADTAIEWAGKSWNFTRGCRAKSPGCALCYAARKAAHPWLGAPGKPYEGLARYNGHGHPMWTGDTRIIPEKLLEPLTWRKGQRIFVNSMSDLWLPDFPDGLILAALAVAWLCPHHRFLCLTKHAERLVGWVRASVGADDPVEVCARALADWLGAPQARPTLIDAIRRAGHADVWPPPNWLQGVSVESQPYVRRAGQLLEAGFAGPWVSAEPLLGPVDLSAHLQPERCPSTGPAPERFRCGLPRDHAPHPHHALVESGAPWSGRRALRWVVVGGESGPGSRRCDLEHIERVVRDGRAAGVPVFVKQLGAAACDERNGIAGAALKVAPEVHDRIARRLRDRKGADMAEWPEVLRVRDFPTEAIPDAQGPRYVKGWLPSVEVRA